MLAIVMSGASNYGAMQAGALEVILQSGIVPEMAVGTSAGGLNAIWLAANPGLEGVERLQEVWRAAGPKEVGVPSPLDAVHRILRKEDGVVSSESLRRYLIKVLPSAVESFAQLKALYGVPAYVTAIDMHTGRLVVFGDRERDRLLDGAMATTAIPPYYPPWKTEEGRFMDGGARSKLPIKLAIERGATRVIALNVSDADGRRENARGVLGVTQFAVSLMLQEQIAAEVQYAERKVIPTRVVHLRPPVDITHWDYTQPERLIGVGRDLTEADLRRQPLDLTVTFSAKVDRWLRALRSR